MADDRSSLLQYGLTRRRADSTGYVPPKTPTYLHQHPAKDNTPPLKLRRSVTSAVGDELN